MSRYCLAANIPFIRQNLCSLSFIDVPQQAYVAAIVRQGAAATAQAVRGRVPASVDDTERERFVQLVLAEFDVLHAGNAVRFGIRPLEYAAWQSRHGRG